MVEGDRGAALLPSLRNVVMMMMVVVLVIVAVKMMIATVYKMIVVMHCGVEGKERVRCMERKEENGRKMRK
jgi:hypothetical protein